MITYKSKVRKSTWMAWVLLSVGLIITIYATISAKMDVEAGAKREFEFACTQIKLRIDARMAAHAQILMSGSALFEATDFKAVDEITREDWHAYTWRQKVEQFLPGVQGVGFALVIPRERLARHIQEIRIQGFPDYNVKPEGDRETYTSIVYLEPFSGRNIRALGYDMFSEPVRRMAMERARDLDSPVLSGKVVLVQETDQDVQAGTLMYVPVYRKGTTNDTVADRRAAIYGWVYSPYRMNDLMQGILKGWDSGVGKRIHLQIYDNVQVSADSLLYDSQSKGDVKMATAPRLTLQIFTGFSDRTWCLIFTQADGQLNYGRVYGVLSGGTIISLLLFGLIISLLNTRYRTQQLAEQLTVDIRESEESYRNQFVNNSAAMLLIDPADGAIIDANVEAISFYGYPRERLLAMRITDINTLPASEVWQAMAAILPKEGKQYEFQHRLVDGSLRDVSVSASRIQFGGRAILHSIIHDITERKLTEDSLQKSEAAMRVLLSEKDVLLKEVHHRVKNNLAAIIGLLDLQGRTLDDKLARAALEELSNRIRSMSLVHEQLYQSKDLSQIDFQDYLDRLIAHLSSSYQRAENIHISVAAKGVKMGLDNAIPCGLLITELVTNAFKYAFPADMPCTGAGAGGCEIAVSMQWDGASYTLVVADNGVGLPAGLDWTKTKTLGLVLVKMLGKHQLQGQVELDCTGGTTFQLKFAPKNTGDFLHTRNS